MTQHAIAALALASSGGQHRRGLGIIVLVVIVVVAAFFLIRWVRSRRDSPSQKGGN